MDFPISVPSIGLVGGKFVDEDQLVGTPGSLIPAQWGNAVTEEILNVIVAGGLTPDEADNAQLLAAIKSVSVSDGVTPGRLIGVVKFTANGTYTPTPGTRSVIVKGVGGGGGGGGSTTTSASQSSVGQGGGGGSYGESRYTAGFSGTVVSIGSGGAAGTAGSAGGAGGATSFGALMSCPGGSSGKSGSNLTPPAIGQSSTAGSSAPTGANISGSPGTQGLSGITVNSISGGISGLGGNSPFGVGGQPTTQATGPGSIGVGNGSGGSGGLTNASEAGQAGGPGTPGILIIYEYA